MTELNLLPWREQRRQRKNKQFIMALILSLVITLLIATAIWGYLRQINNTLAVANQDLIDNTATLEAVINDSQSLKQRRETTLAQLTEVERLAHHRTSFVQLWSELTAAIPKTMYLTEIQSQQGSLVFRGKSRESSEVSKLVAYLQQTSFLQQAKVNSMKNSDSASNSTPYQNKESQAAADSSNNNRHIDFEIVAVLSETTAENIDNAQVASTKNSANKEAGL